jgi:hypothetical protein
MSAMTSAPAVKSTTIRPSAVEFMPNGFASAWVNELVLRGYLITGH